MRKSEQKLQGDSGQSPSATSSKVKLTDRSKDQSLRVLSEEDWEFWVENGYGPRAASSVFQNCTVPMIPGN